MEKYENVPSLRFPAFTQLWKEGNLGDVAQFSKGKGISKADIAADGKLECIRYGELYTHYGHTIDLVKSRTSAKPGDCVLSEANDVIIPASGESHLDIATAACVIKSGIALGGDLNIIRSSVNGVFLAHYLNSRKKLEIAALAQGNSVVHLYPTQLKGLNVNLPDITEQQKIASFLTAVDHKTQQLSKKKALLEQYKKGVIQQLFSQKLRFKDDDGNEFTEWEEMQLKDIFVESRARNRSNQFQEVFSVAKHKGVINQIDHLGRSYASADISNYKVVQPGDVIYTKSPTSDFPFGIVKQNKLNRPGVVSVLYAVLTPANIHIGYMIDAYFQSSVNTYNYLNPLVQKGAKNTMNIGNSDFLNGAFLQLPTSKIEQSKIASFISAIDDKIKGVTQQIELTRQFKKGLLQQMFV